MLELEPGDKERAIVRTLVLHRDLTGPAVHIFVAIYDKADGKYTRTKLAKLLGYHRNTVATAVNLLESKGLVKCPGSVIKLTNIFANL